MPTYQAPVDDDLFLLNDFLRVQDFSHLPGFEDLTPEFCAEVLNTAARFHEEVLHPLNAAGDAEGAHFENGKVTTPKGFPEAWRQYREAGWHSLSLPAELGGAGLPPVMSVPVNEMRSATAHSFGMYGSFCAPAARMLSVLGEPWIKEHVVPRIAAGDWTATMAMTESHCGTDLRQLRTRAVQQEDGSWRIDGGKIFISGAEHDMTENIVHIVLAKVPGEDGKLAPGLASVNVFLVPKLKIDPATGELGGGNGVSVSSIEHKMGIEGSATCVLNFDGAIGWRIADTGRDGSSANMAAMFFLMNHARVGTAMSGVAYAEIARQNATAYARERLSGRAIGERRNPQGPADPIIVHPDIRRLLLSTRAFAEGARATAMRVALWQSLAEFSPNAQERRKAYDLIELMTPVMKAYFTDKGFECTNACLQVLGGHGYVRDHGIEQYVRNVRIGQIYEGANGIQAIDLLNRKLAARQWAPAKTLFALVEAFLDEHSEQVELAFFLAPLRKSLSNLRAALKWVCNRHESHPLDTTAGAYDLLTAFGIFAVGWTWAELAARVVADGNDTPARAERRAVKLALARLWAERELPLADMLCARLQTGGDAFMALPDEQI